MIQDSFFGNPTKTGTIGGLLTILLVNISAGDLLRTVVLAAIGATISFGVSLGWKLLIKKWKR